MSHLHEFIFTAEEFLLLTLKSGVPLNGVDYQSISTQTDQEITNAWEISKKSLQNKGYIGNEKEQSIEIDSTLFQCLEICQVTKDIFSLQIAEKAHSTRLVSYYFGENYLITLEIRIKTSMVMLKAYDKLFATELHLKEMIEVKEKQSQNEELSITFSKSQYINFMSSLQMKAIDQLICMVKENGFDEESARDLIEGFISKAYFVAFSCAHPHDQFDQIMFYKGKRYIWGVRVSDNEENMLQISTTSLTDCYESMLQLIDLNRYKAEEVIGE